MPPDEAVSTFQARFLEAHGSASRPKLLLVDDTAAIRDPLGKILEANGFDVVVAANVNDALKWIHDGSFDVLVSDLHMPLAGDGLTVVSAMRNATPDAVTLIYSGHPSMKDATAAILLQADDILVKPTGTKLLVKTIWERLATGTAPKGAAVADVATILEQGTTLTIENWLERVKAEPGVITVAMSDEDRRSYLPKLLEEVVARLRSASQLGTRASLSLAAERHGMRRREQGYTAAMMVEESRMLQVSIFHTLDLNLFRIDFSKLLASVMTIADEVDSQLAQQMTCYVAEARLDGQPVLA